MFLGVYAIDPKIGMSIPLLEEMHIKSQMIKSASEVAAIVTAKNSIHRQRTRSAQQTH
ncbi:hypothetical protein AAAC51_26805 [Priestia megaterium]